MFNVYIFVTKTELTQNEFETLLHYVAPEKQKRIKRFRFFRDAQNCLLGEVLARVEICRSTGLNMKQLEFAVGYYGKPFLANDPRVQFNISHAGCYVACAVSDEPVGIDIELIKHMKPNIAKRFFTTNETAYIIADDHARRFYEVWTKKESRIKWEGKGLHKPLRFFSVFDSAEQEAIFYHMVFYNGEAICHVCSKKRDKLSVRIIDTDIVMQHIKQLCRPRNNGGKQCPRCPTLELALVREVSLNPQNRPLALTIF